MRVNSGSSACQLCGLDHYVPVGRDLVALDDLLERDLLAVGRAHVLLLDARVSVRAADGSARVLCVTALYSLTGTLTRPKLSVPIHIDLGIVTVSVLRPPMSTRGRILPWRVILQALAQARERLADQTRDLHLRYADPLADLGLRQVLGEAQRQHQRARAR